MNAPCIKSITHVLTVEHTAAAQLNITDRAWYGISLALEGKLVYTHDGRRFVSDSRHIVLLPKGKSYELRCHQGGRFTLVNFLLDTDVDLDTFRVVEIQKPDVFLALHKKLEEIAASAAAGREARMLACLYEMIALTIDENAGGRVPPIVGRALTYMEEQLSHSELDNGSIAAHLGISEVYLRKLFRTYLSTSPKQYLLHLRMERAKSLLLTAAQSVSAIAETCGYATVGRFCRAFRDALGMTPTEYRRIHRAGIL